MSEEPRRGQEEDDKGPGAAFQMFVLMEDLLDKLKLLNYEEEVLRKNNMKALSRHYFAIPTNPGEQFYMFSTLAAWMINKAGHDFEQPQEYDDPNATLSSILSKLRAFGGLVDFPPSKLKAGHGEHVCYVLDSLAEEALKHTGFSWKRPIYPTEELEEESVMEDDAELTLNKLEEEVVEDAEDYEEENYIDLEALKAQTHKMEVGDSAKPEEILESTTDAAEWNLEVERVLPHLKVTIRTDNKDWRIHVDQMHQHKEGIETSLKETKGYLDKLQDEITRNLEKVNSREKYINNQLEHLVQEYRTVQAQLSEAKERYQQGSGGVTERTRILSEITEELEKVKQEMEEKGSSMTDGAPVVKIKQALTKLKQEIIQMDIRIGVVEHTLLQANLKEKSNMTRDMHATMIPESAIGGY
ncbi:intraflagellar transport protein 57 homolog [Latimeria chalumnae]|uniref:Intraflagellar transport protein 57 homolog n=1 Tax=Latimeria chalumnae TaxID=7897 RepID=M3XJ29_LATCH|nr:PREDICTED: intraflagellar transport protein 57 homolog [Latimeria chalumnae]|eukprot:XP_005998731.1 PREDICTED: intraflagellar transport protein 57 homolog [Latimeria chalumnae]